MPKQTKTCPACQQEIDSSAADCPLCNRKLEILHWEIEPESGENFIFAGPEATNSIREKLLSNQLKIADRCRQYVQVLLKIEGDQPEYGIKNEMEWKTIRDYANPVFDLQMLYNPVGAYSKLTAKMVGYGLGALTALGYLISVLMENDAGIIASIFWSIVLLFTNLTVIGVFIISYIISRIYDLEPFAMAFQSYFSLLVGGIVGLIGGWTLGYLIGVFIGLSKKKVLV